MEVYAQDISSLKSVIVQLNRNYDTLIEEQRKDASLIQRELQLIRFELTKLSCSHPIPPSRNLSQPLHDGMDLSPNVLASSVHSFAQCPTQSVPSTTHDSYDATLRSMSSNKNGQQEQPHQIIFFSTQNVIFDSEYNKVIADRFLFVFFGLTAVLFLAALFLMSGSQSTQNDSSMAPPCIVADLATVSGPVPHGAFLGQSTPLSSSSPQPPPLTDSMRGPGSLLPAPRRSFLSRTTGHWESLPLPSSSQPTPQQPPSSLLPPPTNDDHAPSPAASACAADILVADTVDMDFDTAGALPNAPTAEAGRTHRSKGGSKKGIARRRVTMPDSAKSKQASLSAPASAPCAASCNAPPRPILQLVHPVERPDPLPCPSRPASAFYCQCSAPFTGKAEKVVPGATLCLSESVCSPLQSQTSHTCLCPSTASRIPSSLISPPSRPRPQLWQ
jgi:hypothetical protein